jgi:hypothetical protein
VSTTRAPVAPVIDPNAVPVPAEPVEQAPPEPANQP